MRKLLYKICLSIPFAFFLLPAFAQTQSIDSLKKVLQIQKTDTDKVNTMCALAWREVMESDFKSASNYAQTGLNLAKKIDFKYGEAYAYKSFGIIYEYKGYSDSALANFLIALKIYEPLNDRINIAFVSHTIAGIYASRENATEVFLYSNKSLKLYEELKDKDGIASCYYTIADYYRDINGPEAIANYYKALKIYQSIGEKRSAADCFQNIGFAYYYQQNYKEALSIYLEALKIDKLIGNSNGIAQCYIYLSNIYAAQRHYAEALNYDSSALKIGISENNRSAKYGAYYALGEILFHEAEEFSETDIRKLKLLNGASENYIKSLNIFKDIVDSGGMGDCYGQLAEINIMLHQFSKAQKYADSSLMCAKNVNFNDNFEKSYLVQAKLDSALGNYKNAFDHYKLFIVYRDSTFNDESKKKLIQTQMQYDFDKKESIEKAEQDKKDADAKRIKNQQYLVIGSLGILVLAVLIIAFAVPSNVWLYTC